MSVMFKRKPEGQRRTGVSHVHVHYYRMVLGWFENRDK